MKLVNTLVFLKGTGIEKSMTQRFLFALILVTSVFSCEENKVQHVVIKKNLTYNTELTNTEISDLNNGEIIQLEKLIKVCILKYNDELMNNLKLDETEYGYYHIEDFDNYLRQYVPVINDFGEKMIWVNAFCDVPDGWDWHTKLLGTDDGGNCYFQLTINLTTETCSQIHVNDYV